MAELDAVAKWMVPAVPESRVDALWGRIEEATGGRSRQRAWMWPAAIGGVALAAAAAVFLVWLPRSLAPGEGMLTADRPTQGRLSDGSTVELARASEIQLLEDTPQKIALRLRHGAATFDVSKRPSRHFVVHAGGVAVQVVGTRFNVSYDADRVRVSVERGIVEISSDGHSARLTAGGSWDSSEASPAEEAAVLPEPQPAEVAEPSGPAPAPEPAPSRVTRPTRPHPSHSHHSLVAAASPTEDPSALFQSALTARREGRASDAAIALERFLRDHPSDSRASLAAFELGRLRLGELKDVQGAVDSLELCLHLAPTAPFAEEALSRLVGAYDTLGDTANCLRARSRYLARFPSGPYASSVTGRCR